MRIAWLVTTPTPYKQAFFEQLAAQPGLEVRYLFLKWTDPQRPWELDEQPGFDYRALPGISIRKSLRRKAYLRFNPGIVGELRRERYDAVVIGGYDHPTLALAILYCVLSGTPFFLQGESHSRRKRRTSARLVKQAFLFPLLRKCRGAFATGIGATEYWESVGIARERIYRVANTPDIARFREAAAAVKASRRSTPSDDAVPVRRRGLFVGRFDRVKGLDVLLDAMAALPDVERPELWLAGDGPERERLAAVIAAHQLPVRLLGFQQPRDLPALYAEADFFVLPSRHEPWGVVVNEAMACGLPLILSDQVGAGYDLLEDGANGFLFASEDSQSLAAALARLAAVDPARFDQMGEASQAMIREWTPQASVENVVRALTEHVGPLGSATSTAAETPRSASGDTTATAPTDHREARVEPTLRGPQTIERDE